MKKFFTLMFIGVLLSTASYAVSAITGSSYVCVGNTTTLTDSTAGGTWASSNTSIATVGMTSGIVTGVSAGVVTISYITGSGTVVKSITVNPVPTAISGPSTVCAGGTILLTDAVSGGTWSASNPSVATIGSTTGVVTGIAAGTTSIYYIMGGCGTYKIVTVTAAVSPISGGGVVCTGSTITLTDATGGGSWTSSNPAIGTVGSTSGIVTGLAAGTTTISYAVGSCSASKVVTVTTAPAAISGASTVCVGGTLSLSDATAGGYWTTSSTAIATVNTGTGVVTGIAAGVVTISYNTPCGAVTKSVTVNAAPAAISGASTLCVGSSITLTDATPGGTWLSGNTSLATVGSTSGIVTGVAAGTLNVYYSVGGCGAYKTITVISSAPAISGASTVCVGSSTTLTDTATGGTWTSSSTSVATVGSTSGVVTGISAGTATIYYVVGGCATYKIITVSATPAAISGGSTVCVGSTLSLSDATSPGYWTSSSTATATVNTSTGVVTGVAAGVVTISYNTACGIVTKSVTVNAAPAAISGASTLCVGSSITLTDATPGGTWLSGNTSLATVGSASGIVTGVAAGTLNVYYSIGGCGAYKTITVTSSAPAISGASTVCVGSSTTLTDTATGGTWTSSNTSVATVGSTSGVVTGISAGTATIYYMVGGCATYKIVTVSATPAAISGGSAVCIGGTLSLSDATAGGYWTSSSTAIATVNTGTGVVIGVAAGVATISYNTACGIVTKSVTVNAAPSAISGPGTLCVGASITLTDAVTGGTWTSSNTTRATVGSTSGIVTGVSAGTVTIYYLVGGCGTYKVLTVTAAPAAITGSSALCVGYSTTLADATSGGTWSSSGTSIATVGSASGVVTGVSAGVVNIYYTITGCGAVAKTVSVNAAAAPITGSSTVCAGSSIVLSDATSGGTWSSSNTSVATVSVSTGVVTGIAPGTATIYYLMGGCGAYKVITVNAAPAAIIGSSTVCVGSSITLTDAVGGGSWISSGTTVATVGATTGIVTGLTPGTVNIYYSVGGCGTYKVVSVSACTGSIGGGITTGGSKGTSSGVPVVGMLVKLKNTASGSTIAQVYTDAGGLYSFTGLADDTYFVYPESAGYTTTPSSNISITAASNHISDIDFKMNDVSKIIYPVSVTGIDNMSAETINIHPNPSAGKLYINWGAQAISGASFIVTDIAGREVNRTNVDIIQPFSEVQLDLSSLTNGVYFISIRSENVNYRAKVVIGK